MQTPHEMHFFASTVTFLPLFSAFVGQASTHPLQAPPHPQDVHLPFFQQHFL
jgi:hypothetical protein